MPANYFLRSILLFALVLILTNPLIGQTDELNKQEKKTFKTGKKYLKNNENDKALSCFLDIYESSPTNIDNLYYLTTTYNDRLEDYTKVYTYGNELLKILRNRMKTLNQAEDKKEFEETQDLISEIELLVLVAKSNIEETGSTIEDQPTATDENGEEEILSDDTTGKSNHLENTQQAAGENTSPQANDQYTPLYTEFNTIYSQADNARQEIISSVQNEFERVRNITQSYQMKYLDLVQQNTDRRISYANYNIDYYKSVQENEYELIKAIYEYNTSLYQKDSIQKIISILKRKNIALNEEVSSLSWYIDQLDSNGLDSLSTEVSFHLKERIFIGRYKILRSITDKETDKILDKIRTLVQENTDFAHPVINGVTSFINSFADEKYLYLVTKITDTDEVSGTKAYRPNGNNIEVFVLQSGELRNIQTANQFSFYDLGLQENEIKIIQAQSQHTDRYLTKLYHHSDATKSSRDMMFIADKRLNNVLKEIEIVQADINVQQALMNETLAHFKYKYDRQKDDYELKINDYQSYVNYLIIQKELDTKSSAEQFTEIAGELVGLAYDNLKLSQIKLRRIIPFIDSSGRINQIKFHRDSILLSPKLDQYKVLGLSKLHFDDADDIYLAIDMGFKISYDYLSNEPIGNIADGGKQSTAGGFYDDEEDERNTDNSSDEDDYMPVANGIPEILVIDGIPVLKDKYDRRWKSLIENPNSYTSYMMFEQEDGWSLPTYDELKIVLNYLSDNPGKLDQLGWARNSYIYLSNDNYFDNRNNRIFRGLRLNGSSIEEQEVQGGDEVFIIVISD